MKNKYLLLITLLILNLIFSSSVFAFHFFSDNKKNAVNQTQNNTTTAATNNSSKTNSSATQPTDPGDNPLQAITLFNPTYILPAYYTQSPYQAVYKGNTPDNQKVENWEFKGQLSFLVPVLQNIFNHPISLDIAYTQLSYWQIYANSQYFRETDYQPEVFLAYKYIPDHELDFGAVHQSNGRGGNLERSWNRLYLNYEVTGDNWLVAVKPWILIFQSESSDLHNPNIARYLGYEYVLGAYRFHGQVFAIKLENIIESGFSHGSEEFDWSIPLHRHFNLFLQFFSGYGQSLIEYNHYTNAFGVGIALNNWIPA